MGAEVVPNANLKHKCGWCDRAFPRMYKSDGALLGDKGWVVCKTGPRCRPFKRGEL